MNTGKAIRTLMILAATGLVATGCVTAKQASQAASEGTQATPAPATTATGTTTVTPAPATTTTTAAVTPAPQGIVGYVVQKGDHLWGISAKPAVYGDPYQWPLLYKRNRDEIYDPDLIYPGQVLHIERDLSQTQINIAVNHAKTRGAWVLGEIEATDIQYLRKALSW
jgi:nucleoid-associated protein YgaU